VSSSSSPDAVTPLNPKPGDTPLPTDRGEESERVPAQGLGDGRDALPLEYAGRDTKAINPWLFVPVLYFMQFLPNGMVTAMFGATYKSLGIDVMQIATWTGLAALPWSFKMFWGPLVDLNSTKRRWTITMEVLLSLTFIATALAIALPNFFVVTVVLMFLMATLSATHDIACDGLYLMSLDKKRQAAFSGVMAMFSRLGRLFVDGVLLVLAGWLAHRGMALQHGWMVALGLAALLYTAGTIWNFFALPRPAADVPVADVAPGERTRNIGRTLAIIATGVVVYYLIAAALALVGDSIHDSVASGRVPANWNMNDAERIGRWIRLGVCTAALVPLGLLIRVLVRGTPMGEAFVSYVRQPGFGWILGFIIFYRFGEAMIFAMASLFILDKPEAGGMNVTLEHLGVIKMVGQSGGLILGGLLGGWWISRVGLRKAFWPLVVCMHVPNLLYVWAAYELPNPIWLYPVVFLEAFGYGVGFAGYFVYLMHVAQRGRFVTSHYAIGTGLGALFITFATILAGIVQSVFGYKGVFLAACLLTIPGTLILLFIPMDEEETKKLKATGDGH
jgi:PAT family beta-lactamase induction signal transducer AmpG